MDEDECGCPEMEDWEFNLKCEYCESTKTRYCSLCDKWFCEKCSKKYGRRFLDIVKEKIG